MNFAEFERTICSKVRGVITYVKQVSEFQSTEDSSELPHVPLSSSPSCRKPLLCFLCSDLNRFSCSVGGTNVWVKKGPTLKIFTTSLCYLRHSFCKRKKKLPQKNGSDLKIERGYAKNILTAGWERVEE